MPSDWNAKVIEEFRANAGVVANFGGPLLLLHTTGAKTGRQHVTPVMYRKVDGGYAVFASFAGQPRNPAWYHNLVAQPVVVGDEAIEELVQAGVEDVLDRSHLQLAERALHHVVAGMACLVLLRQHRQAGGDAAVAESQ